jgi:hypothetical protein
MGTLTDAKNAIAQSIGQVTSVSVSGDGTLRGARTAGSTSGIYIYRDGTVDASGGGGGGLSYITMQGGAVGWDGALQNDSYSDYTRAQYTVLAELIRHIQKYGKAGIDLDVTMN